MTTDDSLEEPRYVVLGDVVDSRKIEDRTAFRSSYAQARAQIKGEFGGQFVAGPSVLKGIDELGAVLTGLESLYDVLVVLQDALHPHSIRIAVAGGEIEVGQDGDVAHMDGEAFHRATELLESIEADKLQFGLNTDTDPLDTAVADEINLLIHLRASWTDRQREIVSRYEAHGTQRAIAEELGVSQQAVSNVLQGASWPLVETIERRLRETLAAYDHLEAGR